MATQGRLEPGTIAIVDSPRWPRDLDCSQPGVHRREGISAGRAIDTALRRLITRIATNPTDRRISMFPTPPIAYFRQRLAQNTCKPHLRAFGHELFGAQPADNVQLTGGTFTRFMIAGFAVYKALTMLGIDSYEGYPDLQFRLWSDDRPVCAKSAGRVRALIGRLQTIAGIAAQAGITGCEAIRTLDQADAAVLALSAAASRAGGINVVLDHQAEGRFLVAYRAKRMVAFDA
jgi:hypothetical protein